MDEQDHQARQHHRHRPQAGALERGSGQEGTTGPDRAGVDHENLHRTKGRNMMNFFTILGIGVVAYLFVFKLLPWIEGEK
jgi:hypothetical protein